MDISAKDRIIVALDMAYESVIMSAIHHLREHVGMFKFGFESIHAFGTPRVKQMIEETGGSDFIDCKLHDIPETVRKSALQIVGPHVKFFNVHATAGAEAIRAAAEAKGPSKLLAVTLLTSLSPKDVDEIYNADHVERKVLSLAALAMRNGADGVICSPKEIPTLRAHPATKDAILVTPGVRPAGADHNDQKRVMTPGEAILAGADYLVIGRPILGELDSVGAAKRIAEEIEIALASRGAP